MSTTKKLLFSATVVLGFFCLVEVVPRPFVHVGAARFVDATHDPLYLTDSSLGFPRPKPGLDARQVSGEFQVRVLTDAAGNRVAKAPPATEAVEADVDVLFVGDSVTFGHGVEFEDTFTRRLGDAIESDLNSSSGRPVRVNAVNLGCPGTGLRSQRLRLDWYLKQHPPRPRMVVWTTLLNDGFGGGNDLLDTYNSVRMSERGGAAAKQDANNPHLTAESRREEPHSFLYDLKEWLSKHSVAYELAMRAVGLSVRRYAPKEATPQQQEQLRDAWLVFGDELGRIQELTSRAGVPLVVGYYPYFQDVTNGDDRTLRRLHEVAPQGLRIVSLLGALKEIEASYCFPRDGHPTPEGHAAVAREYHAVALGLCRNLLSAPPAPQEKTRR